MSASANPYTVDDDRFNWKELNENLQDMILGHADRRIEWDYAIYETVSEALVPPDIMAQFKAERDEHDEDYEIQLEFQYFCVFERKNGMLGTVTAHFSKYTNRNVYDYAGMIHIPEGLDLDAVAAELDVEHTWSGIIKIRLLPTQHGTWQFELTRKMEDGNKEVILVHSDFYLAANQSTMDKDEFVQLMKDKLHMKHRVVAGVDQFTRP